MPPTIEPTGAILGATVRGVDLARPLDDTAFALVLRALGRHGVLRFPDQDLTSQQLKDFSERLGEIQGSIRHGGKPPASGVQGVGILSNVRENGEYIGSPDAGQDWHTDMSYREVRGFVNVLYALKVPRRDGKVLGGTEFANMHAAYEGLPEAIKTRLDGATATHDFEKFWEYMRREKGSTRPPLTEEQRRLRPPVHHPVFLTHPITGRKVLYCNPGYATRIDGMDERESEEMLAFLFAHQLRDEYRWTHTWTERDVLVWDNLGTIHRAIADYRPDEHRLMKRCQVMATKIFDPEFLRRALGTAPAAA
ncbi:MAG: TauD/TfdA family dioxygenase [Acetobacteraceae bacterium]|nr:TauD/TfdA family dioxygenase [Acetobacteraceae bacterium]